MKAEKSRTRKNKLFSNRFPKIATATPVAEFGAEVLKKKRKKKYNDRIKYKTIIFKRNTEINVF
jgi:hypothetical protein